MKKMIIAFLLVISVCAYLLINNRKPSTPQQKTLEKITFIFPTTAQIEWAPFYTAASKGFYTDVGLEVEFQYSTKGTIAAYEVLNSNQAQFLYSSTENLIKVRDNGMDVKALYLLEPTNLMYIVADKKQNINKPKDLIGKKIGVFSNTGTNKIALDLMLKTDGATLDNIEMIPAGPAVVPGFLEEKFEAALVFLNQRMQIENEGKAITILPASDYGVKSKAHIVAKTEYIQTHADTIKKFLAATQKGISYAAAHPDEAVDIYSTYNPDDKNNKENTQKIWEEMISLFQYSSTISHKEISDDWSSMQDTLLDMKEISNKIDFNLMYTNDFLPSQ